MNGQPTIDKIDIARLTIGGQAFLFISDAARKALAPITPHTKRKKG